MGLGINDLPPEWTMLTPDHFMDPVYRCVFKGVQTALNTSPAAVADPALVADVIKRMPVPERAPINHKWADNPSGPFLEVSDLAGSNTFPVLEALPAMCARLHQKRTYRRIINMAHGIMTKASYEAEDPAAILAQASQDAMDLDQMDPVRSLEAPISFEQRAAMLVGGEPMVSRERYTSLVQFGIPTIDATIKSYAGTLGVVAAKTSAGKTSLIIQAMLNSVDPVLLSFEMEDWEIDAGLIAHITKGNRSELPHGLEDPKQIERLSTKLRTGALANIERLTSISPEFDMVAARIRQLVKQRGRKTIIVDYWTLLDPPTGTNKNERTDSSYARMSRKFRQLSRELGVAIVLLAQFNREIENGKRPTLENLRETGQLEQDANWALMLWTERPTYEPGEVRKVFAELQKNRGGMQWVKATTFFNPSTCTFTEAETSPEVEIQAVGSAQTFGF